MKNMILRKANDRGVTNIGWLNGRHSFSFGRYYDPKFMGFGNLRVINDDIVSPGQGFSTHGHKDMEIITIVLDGELEHRDSLGTGSTIKPGEIQVMSAGSGIEHSEFNHSKTNPLHLLQIWIQPWAENLDPSYQQKQVSEIAAKDKNFIPLVTTDEREGSLAIQQNAAIHLLTLAKGVEKKIQNDVSDHTWIHVISGELSVNGQILSAADAVGLIGEDEITLVASEDIKALVFFI